MKALGIIIGATLALVIGAASLWFYNFPTYTHRYRLTVEVEVDDQVKSGSSVIEVRWSAQPELDVGIPWVSRVKGQAVLVDLDRHGALLAVLWPGKNSEAVSVDFLALRAFGFFLNMPKSFPPDAGGLRKLGYHRGTAVLQWDNMPLFVWLPDAGNPETAKPVLASDLPTKVASNIQLRTARIEMTSDAVTTDLGSKLKWLPALAEAQRGLWIERGEPYRLPAAILSKGVDP